MYGVLVHEKNMKRGRIVLVLVLVNVVGSFSRDLILDLPLNALTR